MGGSFTGLAGNKKVWIKCENCNSGSTAPVGCSASCSEANLPSSCRNTCTHSLANNKDACTACSAYTAKSSADINDNMKDKRGHTAADKCKAACNECKKNDDCIWVAAYNFKNTSAKYKNPSGDDEECSNA